MQKVYEKLIVKRVLDSASGPPPAPMDFTAPFTHNHTPTRSHSIDDEAERADLALIRQIGTLTEENAALRQEIEVLKVSLGAGHIGRLQDALPVLLQVPAEARAATAQAVRNIMHVLVDWVAKSPSEPDGQHGVSPTLESAAPEVAKLKHPDNTGSRSDSSPTADPALLPSTDSGV